MMEANSPEIVIIGAGMSGLAAGIRLAMFGQRVCIVEKHTVAGGLNSFYTRKKRPFDVGLHALTNYVPAGAKGTPLAKILRQLRIDREELALAPQLGSAIHFRENRLAFSNDFSLLENEIAREFPRDIDAFKKLDAFLRTFNETALDAAAGSARECVAAFIKNPRLADVLFLPLSYYGSARPNDMDLPQFAIMWKSIFHEGFSRPPDGVRRIIKLLLKKYRAAGGELRMGRAVTQLRARAGTVREVVLDNGETLAPRLIFSSAGLPETERLVREEDGAGSVTGSGEKKRAAPGELAFCETITVLDADPRRDFRWDTTIIFFCDSDTLHYAPLPPPTLVDPRSGVICIPNNYDYAAAGGAAAAGDDGPADGWLRVTALASYAGWRALAGNDPAGYAAQKRAWHTALNTTARAHLPPVADAAFNAAVLDTDMFTPPTVERFTGRLNGAIYGTPEKRRDGTTALANLFITGTDQGFLGITGALLSGISMANLHALR